MLLFSSPVDGHGREVEDRGGDGEYGEEVVDPAVCGAKVPAVVAHVDVVEGGASGSVPARLRLGQLVPKENTRPVLPLVQPEGLTPLAIATHMPKGMASFNALVLCVN